MNRILRDSNLHQQAIHKGLSGEVIWNDEKQEGYMSLRILR